MSEHFHQRFICFLLQQPSGVGQKTRDLQGDNDEQHQERDVSSGMTEGPEEDCCTSWQVLDVFSMSWALTFAGYVEA